ncbi:unnamed protein product, partial [Polarella glacialis]
MTTTFSIPSSFCSVEEVSARAGNPWQAARARHVGEGSKLIFRSSRSNHQASFGKKSQPPSQQQQQQQQQQQCSELDALLSLGPTPTEAEVSSVLQAGLDRWRENPRAAAVVLSGLARKRLPNICVHILTVMQASRVEVNVYHCTAAISACEK